MLVQPAGAQCGDDDDGDDDDDDDDDDDLILSLQGVCSQLEHSVVTLLTSPGLEEAETALVTDLLNR